MNRSRRRRKRLGLPPYGKNVMGISVPNKIQRRMEEYDKNHGGCPNWRWLECRQDGWKAGSRESVYSDYSRERHVDHGRSMREGPWCILCPRRKGTKKDKHRGIFLRLTDWCSSWKDLKF